MTPLLQEGSLTCGQTCVAMVVGASEMRVCEVVGHIHGCSMATLRKALDYFGVEYLPRLQYSTRNDPMCERFPRSIILVKMVITPKLKRKKAQYFWHAMLRWDGKIYDPGNWKYPGNPAGTLITNALVLTGRPGFPWV